MGYWLEDVLYELQTRHGAIEVDYREEAVYWTINGVRVGATISDQMHSVLIRDRTGKGWIYDLKESDPVKVATEVMEIVMELYGV
jgi:hypothetical protein